MNQVKPRSKRQCFLNHLRLEWRTKWTGMHTHHGNNLSWKWKIGHGVLVSANVSFAMPNCHNVLENRSCFSVFSTFHHEDGERHSENSVPLSIKHFRTNCPGGPFLLFYSCTVCIPSVRGWCISSYRATKVSCLSVPSGSHTRNCEPVYTQPTELRSE